MKLSGILAKVIVVLALVIVSVFYFFDSDQLMMSEEIAQGLVSDLKNVSPDEGPDPAGMNRDKHNIFVIILYSLLAWDLLRKKSWIYRLVEAIHGLAKIKHRKKIYQITAMMALASICFSLYLIEQNIDQFYGTVSWVEVLSKSRGNVNLWSSGQSYILKEVATIVYYFGVFQTTRKLMKLEDKVLSPTELS